MPPVAKVCIQKPGYWRISEEFKMTFRGLKQKRNKRGKNEHWHTPTHTLRAFRSNRFMSKEWWKVFVFKGSDKQLPNQCVGKQGSFGGGAVSCLLLSDKALAGWWEKHHVLPPASFSSGQGLSTSVVCLHPFPCWHCLGIATVSRKWGGWNVIVLIAGQICWFRFKGKLFFFLGMWGGGWVSNIFKRGRNSRCVLQHYKR